MLPGQGFFLSLYVPFCTMTIISCNLLHVCIMRLKGYYSNWCDQKKIQVTLYVFNWLSLNYLVLSLHATDRLNLELAQKDQKLNIEHLKFHISGTNELRAESSRKIFWSPAVRRLSVNCLQLLKNYWANMNQTWHKKFWVKGIQISFNEGPGPCYSKER